MKEVTMATVSDVTLQIQDGPTPSTKKVTVNATASFEASEIGKNFGLGITLKGEDAAGDHLPSGDSAFADTLYTFKWGSLLGPQAVKPVKASAQPVMINESRTLDYAVLDEDTGTVPSNVPELPPMARKDEVYAVVTLSATVSAVSATVNAGGLI